MRIFSGAEMQLATGFLARPTQLALMRNALCGLNFDGGSANLISPFVERALKSSEARGFGLKP